MTAYPYGGVTRGGGANTRVATAGSNTRRTRVEVRAGLSQSGDGDTFDTGGCGVLFTSRPWARAAPSSNSLPPYINENIFGFPSLSQNQFHTKSITSDFRHSYARSFLLILCLLKSPHHTRNTQGPAPPQKKLSPCNPPHASHNQRHALPLKPFCAHWD